MARKTETLIRLNPVTKEALRSLAEDSGLSQSQLVEQLIQQEAKRRAVKK